MLVDYGSDSDSDSPAAAPAPPPAAKPKLSASLGLPKPKVVSTTTSAGTEKKKIVVNIPKPELEDDEPKSKRQRVGGGGMGLAALLPAPKRSGANAPPPPPEPKSEVRKRVLGGGAAKDDELEGLVKEAEPQLTSDGDSESKEVNGEDGKAAESAPTSTTPATVFIPRSTGRKPILPTSAFKRKKAPGSAPTPAAKPATPAIATPTPVEPPKPAPISLFGSGPSLTELPSSSISLTSSTSSAKAYQPIIHRAPTPPPPPVPEEYETNAAASAALGPQTLEEVARNAGLDESAMRQLRGRNRDKDIKIINFDVDKEYQQNDRDRMLGLVEEFNPVRSIAPGKHQLTSLLNIAQSQKGALEEHFAQGKRNKKEAGAKYGW